MVDFTLIDGEYGIEIRDSQIILRRINDLGSTHTFTTLKEMYEKLQSKCVWMDIMIDQLEKLQHKAGVSNNQIEQLRKLVKEI